MSDNTAPKLTTAPAVEDWQTRLQARLDRVASEHAGRVRPLAKRHNLPVESAALIVLSLSSSVLEDASELAAVTRAVVAEVEAHHTDPWPVGFTLAAFNDAELVAELERRKQADR
jgi:hypothetical protein